MKIATKAIRIRARARGLAWRKHFLEHLRCTGNVNFSAQASAINPATVHRHRQRDPKFAAQWKEALAEAIDRMEIVARSRAVNGTDEAVWMKDETGKPILVGHVRRYSDYLLGLLLKAHLPGKYGNQVQAQIAVSARPQSKADKFDFAAFNELLRKTYGGEDQKVEQPEPEPVKPTVEKMNPPTDPQPEPNISIPTAGLLTSPPTRASPPAMASPHRGVCL